MKCQESLSVCRIGALKYTFNCKALALQISTCLLTDAPWQACLTSPPQHLLGPSIQSLTCTTAFSADSLWSTSSCSPSLPPASSPSSFLTLLGTS